MLELKHWLVNTNARTVRPAGDDCLPARGEMVFRGMTASEAAGAGSRRALAEEALFVAANLNDAITRDRFVIVGDAIEAQASRLEDAREACLELVRTLGSVRRLEDANDASHTYSYECWIEAECRVLVLGRVP